MVLQFYNKYLIKQNYIELIRKQKGGYIDYKLCYCAGLLLPLRAKRGATVPSKQGDGEVAFIRTVSAPDVQLPFVPDQNVFCSQQYGPVGVSNHQLSYRAGREKEKGGRGVVRG